MEKLIKGNQNYHYFKYDREDEFEREVVDHTSAIFGEQTIYVDTKKKIGDSIVSIPDGYLLDFSFPTDPKLYIIENELSSHDPYKHIGAQILRFAISYKESGRKIKWQAFIVFGFICWKVKYGLRNKIEKLEATLFQKKFFTFFD